MSLVQTFLGANNGVIGCSTAGLLLGGIYLLIVGGITWEIPVSVLVSFTAFIALFGGHGFDVQYLLMQLAGGGIVMGAFFMATPTRLPALWGPADSCSTAWCSVFWRRYSVYSEAPRIL